MYAIKANNALAIGTELVKTTHRAEWPALIAAALQAFNPAIVALVHGDGQYAPECIPGLLQPLIDSKIPTYAVLGNHDYESGEVDQVKAILGDAGVIVLDGDAHEINGVGFAGAKGLGGGFGGRALQPWGEDLIKRFVRETVDEALKLDVRNDAALREQETAVRLQHRHRLGHEPVVRPRPSSRRLDEPRLAQDLEVVRDRRLRELEGLGEVADTDLVSRRERVDDRNPRRIGERLETRRELFSGGAIERLGLRTAADRLENGKSLHRWISMYHPPVSERRMR